MSNELSRARVARKSSRPGRRQLKSLLAAVAVSITGPTALADDVNWNGSGTAWDAGASWSTSTVPTDGDVAVFANTVAQTVNLNGAQSIAGLKTDSANTVLTSILGGNGNQVLTLGTSGINHTGGGLTIGSATDGQRVSLSLAGSQTWTSSTGGTGAVAITVLNDISLANTGAQTLTLTGTNTGTTATGIFGNISDGAGVLSISRSSGTAGSAWTLSGNNTFTGGISLSSGILRAGSATAFGATASTLTISGGNIDAVAAGVTLTNNNAQVWNGNFTFNGTGSLNLGSGNVSLGTAAGTARTITTSTTSTNILTIGGVISDGTTATGITKAGTGSMVLSGANSYTGVTTISAGILNIQNPGALGGVANGTVVSSGGTLALQGGITITDESLSLVGDGASNAGALRSISGDNTYSGPITFGSASITRIASDAGLLTINGVITSNLGATQQLVLQGTGSGLFSSPIGGIGRVTRGLAGSGVWTLSGANTYTGQTAISGGTLSVASLNRVVGGTASSNLGAPTTVATGTIDIGSGGTTGTLQYTGAGETTDRVINLAGTTGGGFIDQSGAGLLKFTSDLTAVAGAKTLTLTGSGNGEFAGNIVNSAGTIALTKNGTGTWTLSGPANAYSGTTTVTAGKLLAAVPNAIPAGVPLVMGTAATANFDLNGFDHSVGSLAGGSATGGSITLGAGTLTIGSDTSTTFSGAIGGSGGIIKVGSGTLTFGGGTAANNGAHSYSGGLVIKSGTVSVANSATALGGSGTGAVTLGDATLAANATLRIDSSTPTFNNPLLVADAGAATLTVTNNAPSVGGKYGGAVTLAHELVIQTVGTGSLAFSGGFSGAGNIRIDNSGTTSQTTLSGAAINHVGQIINTGASTGSTTISAVIGANVAGVLQNSATSPLILSANNASFAGPLTVNAGRVNVTGTVSLNANTPVSLAAGTTFDVQNNFTIAGLNNISGNGGTVNSSTATARTLTLGGGGSYHFSGPLAPTTPANLALTVSLGGSGSQTLAGDNTYTGNTAVNRGTLVLQRSGGVGSMGATAITVGSGATPTATAGHATLNIAGNYTIGTPTGGSLAIRGGNVGTAPIGQGTLSLLDGAINTLTLGNPTAAATNLTLGGAASGNYAVVNLDIGSSTTDQIVVTQNLLVDTGGATVNLNQLSGSPLAAGTYTLMTYAARTLTGTFTLGSTPAQAPGSFTSYTLNETGTALQLVASTSIATGASAYWTGDLGAVWNMTSGPNSNFTHDQAGTTSAMPPGSNTDVFFAANLPATLTSTLGQDFAINSLTFNTNASTSVTIGGAENTLTILASGGAGIAVGPGSGNHTINSKVALGTAQTWDVAESNKTLTVNGAVSGNFALTKIGLGTIVLAGSNSYGATNISFGTLQIGSGGASGTLGTGPVTNNGTLIFNRSDAALVVPNVISGNGTLTKTGAGTVTLTGANDYTGQTNITQGVLNIQHNTALGSAAAGTVVSAGAGLQLQGGITVTGESLTTSVVSSGNALVNVSGNNTWTGTVTGLGDGSNNFRFSSQADLLTVSGNISHTGSFTSGVSGTGLVIGGSGSTVISGVISGSMGVINTTQTTGSVTLSGANTYTRNTRLQSSGPLVVFSINTIGANAVASSSLGAPTTEANGTIHFGQNSNSLAGHLRYSGTVNETSNRIFNLLGNSGTATIEIANTANLTLTSNLTATGNAAKTLVLTGSSTGIGEWVGNLVNGSGTTSVNKTGTGTWILSGSANSYTGATSITGGSLVVNGAITGVGNVTVSTAGVLAGIGSIAGPLTINAGGAVSPGDNNIESLATADQTWNGGGVYRWEIGAASGTPGVNWDVLNLSNGATKALTVGATLASKFTIEVVPVGTMTAAAIPFDTWYTIAHADTLNPSDFNRDKFGFVDPGTGEIWDIRAVAATGGGFDVQISIPEPATLGLMGVAAVGLLSRRRRRK